MALQNQVFHEGSKTNMLPLFCGEIALFKK